MAAMPTDTEKRKNLLGEVRSALATGERGQLERLLEVLPEDSRKMREARAEIKRAITLLKSGPAIGPSPPPIDLAPSGVHPLGPDSLLPTAVNSGQRVRVALRRGGDDLLRVVVCGCDVEVIVNADHAAAELLLRSDGSNLLQPAAEAFLTAWAILEVEAGTPARRDKLMETRLDLTRVLRRLARE